MKAIAKKIDGKLFAVQSTLKAGDVVVCTYHDGRIFSGQVEEFLIGGPGDNWFEYENNPFFGAHIADDDEDRDLLHSLKKADGSEAR